MKKNILLILLSCCTFICLSLSAIPQVFGQEANDAFVEKQTREYTLSTDGRIEYRQYKRVKLLTYNSIHRMYGETFLIYNSKYQQLKVLHATTTMRDGSKVIAPPNAFNEVLPRYAANAPDYNYLKEMVVTHTGLEVGATTELDYSIISSADYLPGFMATEVLTELSPVGELEVIVRVPENQNLVYRLLNIKSEPAIQMQGQYKVYRWNFRDLPASIAEPNQAESSAFQPTLILSSLSNQAVLSKWIDQQAMSQQDLGTALNSRIASLRKDENDDLRLALKLQEIIVNEIVNIGIPFSVPGFRGRGLKEVWESAYATGFEKANLLSGMLREANIKAEVVVMVPAAYSQEIVSPGLWMDFGVCVTPKKGKPVYLSVRELNPQDLQLIAGTKGFLPIPAMNELRSYHGDDLASFARLEVSGSLSDKSSLSADIHVELRGSCVPYLEMIRSESKASALVGGLGKTLLKEGKIEKLQPGLCNASTSLGKELEIRKEGQYLFLGLPYPEQGINSWHLGEMPEKRVHPYEILYPLREEIRMDLLLPENIEVLSPRNDIKISNVAGSLSMSFKRKGNNLVVEKVIDLNKSTFAPGYYAGLRELLNNWNTKVNKELVLKIN